MCISVCALLDFFESVARKDSPLRSCASVYFFPYYNDVMRMSIRWHATSPASWYNSRQAEDTVQAHAFLHLPEMTVVIDLYVGLQLRLQHKWKAVSHSRHPGHGCHFVPLPELLGWELPIL